jgi:dTDP-4-amino-4,6-dideoxygalactose transaminase
MLPTLERRTSLIKHLKEREITAVFHYLPLHLSEYALKLDPHPRKLPVTEKSSDTLLRLPLYSNMTEAEQTRVIEALNEWR